MKKRNKETWAKEKKICKELAFQQNVPKSFDGDKLLTIQDCNKHWYEERKERKRKKDRERGEEAE